MYKTINEAHGLAPADIKRVKDLIEKTEDKEIKRILKFLVKSNVEVDKTQDVTKMKKENKHPMKITTKNLKKVIEEEVRKLLEGEFPAPMDVPGMDPDALNADPTVNLNAGSSIDELVFALQAMAKRVYSK